MGLSQSDFCFYVYFTFYKRKKKHVLVGLTYRCIVPFVCFFPPKNIQTLIQS